MCIAIMNAGKQITKKKLQNCWNYNDDGAGMLYVQDGMLRIEKFPNKGVEDFDKFFSRYVELKSSDVGNLPMLLHFRIATHGMSDEYLHPFPVTDSLGLIHNGVIPGFGTKDKSDTAEFAELVGTIPNLDIAMLDNPFIEDSIFTYLGSTNKVVFMDNNGEYRIFNEKLGEWIGDNWFSNDSHSKAVRYYGSTAVSAGSTYNFGWDEDDLDADLEAQLWNESFDAKGTDYVYDSEDVAPVLGHYDCPNCGREDTCVTFNSECTACNGYVEEAVNEVIDLWQTESVDWSDKL